MTAATLVALALLAPAAPPDGVGSWITRLGAPRYADREQAVAALVAIGDPAIPSLVQAGDATRDPEVHVRVAAVIGAIRRQRLTRPTLVTLNLRDCPLGEAVEALASRGGLAVGLDPDVDNDTRTRPVTLECPEPIPFWEALDRLCQAGGVHPVAGSAGEPTSAVGALNLIAGPPDSSPHFYSGPFRVRWASPGPRPHGVAIAPIPQLEVVGEPGLFLSAHGPPVFSGTKFEASPALPEGQPFVGIISAVPATRPAADLNGLRWDVPPAVRNQEASGRLSGKVRVSVATRDGDPTVLPLAKAPGQSFLVGDTTVQVERILSGPREIIQVALRLKRGSATPDPFPTPSDAWTSSAPGRVEVVDAQGLPCRWTSQGLRPRRGGEALNLLLSPGPSGAAPSAFRIHNLIETTADVTFHFGPEPTP